MSPQLVPPVPHVYQKTANVRSHCGTIKLWYTVYPNGSFGGCDDQPLDLGRPIFETEFTILKMQPDYMAVREILDFVP